MKTLKIICAALMALATGGPAFSQSRHPQNAKAHYRHHRTAMARKLDLTQDQRKQIKQIKLDLKKDLLPLKNQMNEKRAKLHTLTTGTNADFDTAQKVVDQMAGLRAEMMKRRLQGRKEIRDLLTDEQRVKFDSFLASHDKRGFVHRGRGRFHRK